MKKIDNLDFDLTIDPELISKKIIFQVNLQH